MYLCTWGIHTSHPRLWRQQRHKTITIYFSSYLHKYISSLWVLMALTYICLKLCNSCNNLKFRKLLNNLFEDENSNLYTILVWSKLDMYVSNRSNLRSKDSSHSVFISSLCFDSLDERRIIGDISTKESFPLHKLTWPRFLNAFWISGPCRWVFIRICSETTQGHSWYKTFTNMHIILRTNVHLPTSNVSHKILLKVLIIKCGSLTYWFQWQCL